MPDITMCEGRNCKVKGQCYRHTAKPSQWQAMADYSLPAEPMTANNVYEITTTEYCWNFIPIENNDGPGAA